MILSDLNDMETKFEQHYKEKGSNFIIILKSNNQYFDHK